MSTDLIPRPSPDGWAQVKSLVLNAVTSPHSRRAYSHALDEFQRWLSKTPNAGGLNKAAVHQYRAELEARGLAPSSINVQMSAIRKLAIEASDNGLLDLQIAGGISRVKGVKRLGVRTGNWLTADQAEQLLELPDRGTTKGKRDRALLALLIGCGLRREEISSLQLSHIEQRDSRWALVDITGKGQRLRTVPMPAWSKTAVDEWTAAAGIREGWILRRVNKSGRMIGQKLSPQSVFDIVKEYGAQIGVDIAPHDLRRSFAKLAHKGRAAIEQIQISLGHSSIQTTERYLGIDQDLVDAPCDHLGLRVDS